MIFTLEIQSHYQAGSQPCIVFIISNLNHHLWSQMVALWIIYIVKYFLMEPFRKTAWVLSTTDVGQNISIVVEPFCYFFFLSYVFIAHCD